MAVVAGGSAFWAGWGQVKSGQGGAVRRGGTRQGGEQRETWE